jgi:hypothetical protein
VLRFGLEEEEEVSVDEFGMPAKRKAKKPIFPATDRDDQGMTPWIMAVVKGHIQVLREIVALDANHAEICLYSLSGLHVAACLNNLDTVEYLFGELHIPLDVKVKPFWFISRFQRI